MRILYHHRTMGHGAEGIHVREMIKAFRKANHKVLVVGPVGETGDRMSKNVKIIDNVKKRMPSVLFELLEMSYNIYGFIALYKAIKSFKPDFIYDRYVTFNGSSVITAFFFDLPVIIEVNAPYALQRSEQVDEQLFFKKMGFYAEKWICSNATKTIVVSTPLAEYLRDIGIPEDKLIIMPNGVDKEKFCIQQKSKIILKQLGHSNCEIIVGFSGILRPWHGIDLLIKAVGSLIRKKVPIFLLIVGDGPIRQEVEKLIIEEGIKNQYKITGFIPHDQVPGYVNLFDIAVSPKSTFYASPMKLIEYMSLGKAVVVPNSKNFLDIIDPDENGITFKENDIDSLKEALAELSNNAKLRKQLGLNARLKVEKRLNWGWNAKEVCKLVNF